MMEMARAIPEATLSSSENRLDLLADVCKFGKLSVKERRELISSLEKGSLGVRDVLHSWSRRQLRNYLNLKTGEEKKYTSYSKHKLIDRLLGIGLEKSIEITTPSLVEVQNAKEEVELATSRAKKAESPSMEISNPGSHPLSSEEQSQISLVCENSACRGRLSATDLFCRRCSCCICHLFDDNKDPSLWIVCAGGWDGKKDGCNLSCHIECALKLQLAGVVKREFLNLDGSYSCPSCGVVSDLLECLKKQILVAKEARRIDILCYRLYLTFRLLNGTARYQKLLKIVSDAACKLEQEIGPLSEASATLVRGIVGRLSTGAEVQKLLQSALEKLEQCVLEAELQSEFDLQGTALSVSNKALRGQVPSEGNGQDQIVLHVVDVTCTSITVCWDISQCVAVQEVLVQKLWHHKSSETDFRSTPTVELSNHEQKVTICSLEAATDYALKLTVFGKKGIIAQAKGRCFTKDNVHVSAQKNQLKAAGKIASMPLDVRDRSKESISTVTIDGADTTFKVRDLGNASHNRHLECVPAEPLIPGIRSSRREEGLKIEQLENVTSDEFPPLNTASCLNILSRSESPKVQFEQGSRKRRRQSNRKTQEKASVSTSNLDQCKGATEILTKLHPVSNISAVDPSSQSECIIRVLDAEISPSVSRSKESNDANPSEPLLTDVLPATDIAASGDRIGIDSERRGLEFENFTNSNSQQNDEFQLILHPSIEEVSDLNPRKRISIKLQPGQTVSRWRLSHQQHIEPQPDEFFEFWVKVVRWLECEGHLRAHFRMRFLSWLGLRATEREKRVITAFFNSMLDDPSSLAEQLIDTFQEIVTKPRAKVSE